MQVKNDSRGGPNLACNCDLDRLLKLRVLVARFGEMDIAKWWNTNGQLSRLGAVALRRGFPRTHYFAQSRAVFSVAARRTAEVFDPPGCVTLWHLPEEIDEEFDSRWEHWLEEHLAWQSFFEKVEAAKNSSLGSLLADFGLITEKDIESCKKLRVSSEGRALSIPKFFSGTDEDITFLALGFSRGNTGNLVVPYARRDIL